MITRRHRGLAIAGAFALMTASASAQQPSPEDRAQARTHFLSGVSAYGRREWTVALEAFQSAYRLAPHPSVRVNMANCFVELGRPVEALENFERFLAEAPNAQPAQRLAVEAHVRELRSTIGEVTVTTSPGDAAGSPVVPEPRPTPPSPVAVVAPSPPVPTVARVSLEETPARPAESAEPRTEPRQDFAPRRHGPPPAVFWTAVGVTGAASIALGVFGALALSAQSDFDASVRAVRSGTGDPEASRQQGLTAADRADRYALFSDVALALAATGLGAAVTLFFLTDFRSRRPSYAAVPLPGGGAIALLQGRF